MSCYPSPPGLRPHPGLLPQLPLLTLTPSRDCIAAPPASLQSASITCLLAFPAWLWGFRWLFLLSGSSPEVSFDLHRGRGNGKMMRDARSLSASDSFCGGGKSPLLKQASMLMRTASWPVSGWGSPFFLGWSWKRNKNSTRQKPILQSHSTLSLQ